MSTFSPVNRSAALKYPAQFFRLRNFCPIKVNSEIPQRQTTGQFHKPGSASETSTTSRTIQPLEGDRRLKNTHGTLQRIQIVAAGFGIER